MKWEISAAAIPSTSSQINTFFTDCTCSAMPFTVPEMVSVIAPSTSPDKILSNISQSDTWLCPNRASSFCWSPSIPYCPQISSIENVIAISLKISDLLQNGQQDRQTRKHDRELAHDLNLARHGREARILADSRTELTHIGDSHNFEQRL